jgi:putative component of membrane protein insertase Oxa1/YidC/SpoIIIJ protein YidD
MQLSSQRGIIAKSSSRLIALSEFLESIGLQGLLDGAVDGLIRFYQRHLSPRKGFSCAHLKLHGSTSCSGHFRQLLGEQGLSQALRLFPERLSDCRQAYLLLRMQSGMPEESDENDNKSESPRRSRSRPTSFNSCGDGCSIGDCGYNFPDSSCDTNHNGACDVGDLGGCDGLDCGGCDCNF